MAADVMGFSRLMGADEAGTARALRVHREAMSPIITEHGGRIVKTIGDGVLLEFPSVVAAVSCAAAIQRLMAERNAVAPADQRMLFRVGINLGDVLIEGDDILGDGVNVAARLEEISEAGGICISEDVHRQIDGKVDLNFVDMGVQHLKNIARPLRTYRAYLDQIMPSRAPVLALPDRPSIAVLPFGNMSSDPAQDYFGDGIVEEIIIGLSRIRWLFVIARNSSFTYKGRAVDVKHVGRELGVRYVLEGSVRRAANRVRISAELVEAATGMHIWADRFEGGIEDIFELQDHVTANVVGAIGPKLEQAEIERAKRKPTENLDAYDYFLRGMAALHRWSREANNEALRLFYRAIELDPEFAAAYGMAARCYSQRKASGWMVDRAHETAETERLARRAAALGKDDAVALSTAGIAFTYVLGALDHGADLLQRALALNPNWAPTWLFSGWAGIWRGEPEVALDHLARAMRLNPQDPQMFNAQAAMAAAYFFAGRYDDASAWARAAIREQPVHFIATCVAAASHALAGQAEEAAEAMTRLRQLDPDFRLSSLSDLFPIRRPEDRARWADGLRNAGLPP
ncbi:adenylate/guanylate cyclase domain-containing protein [Rhizobium herbae]|uniref:Adenylate/guanylate cyclase domain-containing protein n=1 Tax=Rhizobium herbae TaxID=508661 RepID=A0ABS7HA75_9HYPH|nr:adenylate/guanylate cyclase domain-containing protein [Rhizobium herbae]MBW9064137.1 adenylate/guanylate cyclase domain-containing protein [Rhizobium herbae]